MIIDKLLQVSTSQVVTVTAVSTDTIDLSQAKDIGEGENLYFNFNVEAAPTTPTSVEFQVITSASAALSTPTIIGTSGAIAIASLPINTNVIVRLNARAGSTGQRYLGVQYTIVGTTTTSGTYSSAITHDLQDGKKFYASGFSVT
jgi:hypothetical protein